MAEMISKSDRNFSTVQIIEIVELETDNEHLQGCGSKNFYNTEKRFWTMIKCQYVQTCIMQQRRKDVSRL